MKVQYKALSFFYDLIDTLYFSREQYSPRTALLSFIPDTPVRVLDVCAGTGSNSLLIAKSKPGAKITAIDLSADMLKIAEKKFHNENITNVDTLVADARNTGFGDNSFDIVLLSLVLHEIGEELRQTIINEVKRILRHDGRIIIIEWEQPVKRFQRFMFSPIKSMEPNGFKDFLRTDLTNYFRTFGLNVIERQSCDYTQVLALLKK